MSFVLYPALWVVSGVIFSLLAIGVGCEWTSAKLVPLQKFLTKKIVDRT